MFTCNIQLAGYDYHQYDDKGETDITHFLEIIEQFPWMEQLEKYRQVQQGASATVSAINSHSNHVLWVSIASEKNKYHYLVGYIYSKTVKGFLGLGAEKVKRWLDIYVVDDFNVVKELFTCFFSGDEPMLKQKLSLEEIFQSMAA